MTTQPRRPNWREVVLITGILGVVSLSLLAWYGVGKTGEVIPWLLVPIVVCLLMIAASWTKRQKDK